MGTPKKLEITRKCKWQIALYVYI